MAEYQNQREIALEIIMEVMEEEQYSHIVIRRALEKYDWMDAQNKAFITKLSQGTIERCIEMDAILDHYSKVKTAKMKPLIRNLLRMSVYQIKYMDSVPNRAVCNEAVKITVAHGFSGLKGFVNGVLRTVARENEAGTLTCSKDYSEDCIRYSIPQWIIDMITVSYGADRKDVILTALTDPDQNRERRTFARILNSSKKSCAEIFAGMDRCGISYVKDEELANVFSVSNENDFLMKSEVFEDGSILIQDKSSMLCACAVGVMEGSRVLDACAAPGGKSIFLADSMNSTGKVIACDISDMKLELMKNNISRTGLINVEVMKNDALVYREEWEGSFDTVLCDLPCSGLGIIEKKGDIKYKMTPEKQEEIVSMQRKMLDMLKRYVKPGGYLFYSTCTIAPTENIGNRKWFLEQNPTFRPISLEVRIPQKYWHDTAVDGYVQLLPGMDDTDGFFFAGFQNIC